MAWINFHSSFTQKSLNLRFFAAPLVVLLSDKQLSFLPATVRSLLHMMRPRRTATVSAQAIERLGWSVGVFEPLIQANWAQTFPTIMPIPNSVEASPTHPTFHSTSSGTRRVGANLVRVFLQNSMSSKTSGGALIDTGFHQPASHLKFAVRYGFNCGKIKVRWLRFPLICSSLFFFQVNCIQKASSSFLLFRSFSVDKPTVLLRTFH